MTIEKDKEKEVGDDDKNFYINHRTDALKLEFLHQTKNKPTGHEKGSWCDIN